MERREFVARIGTAALAWPLTAHAQRTTIPFVGFLNSGSPNERAHLVEAFRGGLKEAGYIDGKDVAIEYRWAEGRLERLPQLAKELASRQVAVITATGSLQPAVAAKAATQTIPIVFTGGGDPVKLGLVASLSRPGGNLTGIANLSGSLDAKRIEILHELVPRASKMAYLANPRNLNAKPFIQEVQAAATRIGTELHVVNAGSENDIDTVFAAVKKGHAAAMVVASDPFFLTRRDQIVALAARHAIPASYASREFAAAGGLMTYGANLRDIYRQAGVYTGRILKGARPADMPVIQASKLELVVNLKTARKLGLTISREFLARADEVIQ